jgi:precorrin-8X/cobalt-precorrin-8 methylmutase
MKYLTDPRKIKQKELTYIHAALNEQYAESYANVGEFEKGLIAELCLVTGDLSIIEKIRISDGAIKQAQKAIKKKRNILCDNDRTLCHLNAKYLYAEPFCFIQKPTVVSQAKALQKTRGMMGINHWKPHIENSIVLMGDQAANLFYLLECLEEGFNKPALVIGLPGGFIEATQAKQLLWNKYQTLGIECITLQGVQGGSELAATVTNVLLKSLLNPDAE